MHVGLRRLLQRRMVEQVVVGWLQPVACSVFAVGQ